VSKGFVCVENLTFPIANDNQVNWLLRHGLSHHQIFIRKILSFVATKY